MRAGLTAVVAVVGIAACGASDRVGLRAVAPSTTTTAVLRGDAVRYVPRPVPTTRASRGATRHQQSFSPRAKSAVPTGDVWARLAQCESGTRNLRNYPYSGFFQFLASTWRSLGYSGIAADHPYETQRAGALRLLARSGRSQWPVCGPKVGL